MESVGDAEDILVVLTYLKVVSFEVFCQMRKKI